jgi:drug/metabolite transporter (DMT)-like permease
MDSKRPGRSVATILALASALSWASYYVFVLWLAPLTSWAVVIVYPFLVGGVIFLAWALARGERASFLALWRDPMAYVRILLAVVMQIASLAATYSAGPIDTSLLALLGDVVVVPLLLMVLYREDRDLARTPWFTVGVLICLVGGGLTIVGGKTLTPVSGWTVLVVPVIPLSIGLYFLLTARAARTTSLVSVNAQAMLGSALVSALLTPLFPVGQSSLALNSLEAVGILVALGVAVYFLAPVFYFVAIERGGLVPTAILMSLIPAFTLVLSLSVLGIAPSLLAAFGIPIAIVGAFCALEGQNRPRKRIPPETAPNLPAATPTG